MQLKGSAENHHRQFKTDTIWNSVYLCTSRPQNNSACSILIAVNVKRSMPSVVMKYFPRSNILGVSGKGLPSQVQSEASVESCGIRPNKLMTLEGIEFQSSDAITLLLHNDRRNTVTWPAHWLFVSYSPLHSLLVSHLISLFFLFTFLS